MKKQGQAAAKITNKGPASAIADWYQWGIKDGKNKGLGSNDILGVGAQSFPAAEVLVFSIGTRHRWSNAAEDEFDIYVDVNNDGIDDYLVAAVDFGAITAGEFNGVTAVAVFDLNERRRLDRLPRRLARRQQHDALPVYFSQLQNSNPATSLGGANQRFTYRITSFGLTDNTVDDRRLDREVQPLQHGREHGHVRCRAARRHRHGGPHGRRSRAGAVSKRAAG